MRGQAGFFDLDERLRELSAKGDTLERLNGLVDFELFRPDLERAAPRADRSRGGRPPFDHVFMFKVLILQASHSLSDERTEFLIKDRLSFMRFLGLGLADPVPDANTIWSFRETLTRATPLILTGLSAAIAFRARLFNIGAEGQLYAGALAAVAVGGMHGGGEGFALAPWLLLPLALTLAIGFLVDDAIVFLENTVRRMERGERALEATLNSAREISFTIFAMTISLAAVFLPLLPRFGMMTAVPPAMRDEIAPKNIMLIGPTGVGKTEIARRLAKLAGAPFIKVEASKFTEVGYVGRDVDSMVRDLAETAVSMLREEERERKRNAKCERV